MGLRLDKQRRQRREILENAFAFLLESGGRLPTMAELARRSRISDATLFNYVGQRDALLAEWAHRDLGDRCRAAAQEGGSLRRTLRRAGRDLRARLEAEPAVWTAIWAAATPTDPAVGRPGGPEPGAEGAALVACVRVAQDRGEVRADVDADVLAQALTATWLGALAREARRADSSRLDADAWRRVDAAVELVLDGLRKRNERVRMGREGGASPSTGAVRSLPGT